MTDDNLPTDPTEPFVPMAPVEPIESNAIAFGGPVRTSTGRPIAVRAGILAGSAVLVVIGAVAAMGASPTPATGADPSTAPNSTAAPNASKDPETLEPHDQRGPAGAFPGFGFKGGAFGGLGRFGLGGITITAVNGSDVSLKTDDGWTRTITVTDATKITKGGAAIKVGDLAAGDKVRLAQDRAADGTYTVTGIVVVLPTVAGQVSAVDGNTVTVTQPGGTKATIHVSGTTTYQVNGAKGALSDVKVGSFIAAEGTQRSDGSLDATTVHLGFGGRSSVGGPGTTGTPGFPGGHKGPKPNASPAPSGSAG